MACGFGVEVRNSMPENGEKVQPEAEKCKARIQRKKGSIQTNSEQFSVVESRVKNMELRSKAGELSKIQP